MAQRVNVILVDDLNGADAAETVTFGLDGVSYEIDLSHDNAAELRAALSRYIEVARKVGGRRKGQRSAQSGRGGTSASDIRQWARENGWDVPERGRVAADVREAYTAAH
jgi:hypothetical protein